MSGAASGYPIQQFLHLLIERYGPTPTEFVRTLGYSKHVERALHRLGLWLSDGQGYDKIIRQISWKYPDYAAELDNALDATKDMKTAEFEAKFLERCKAEEHTFLPFIHAQGEKMVPSGITVFGLTGGHRRWTRIEVPKSILKLPLEKQLSKLPSLMLAYKRKYNGAVPFFGGLTGFKFVRQIDHFLFDSDAQLLEHVDKPFRSGECSVALH